MPRYQIPANVRMIGSPFTVTYDKLVTRFPISIYLTHKKVSDIAETLALPFGLFERSFSMLRGTEMKKIDNIGGWTWIEVFKDDAEPFSAVIVNGLHHVFMFAKEEDAIVFKLEYCG